MGLAHARLKLGNARPPDRTPIRVTALADTGGLAFWRCEDLAVHLQTDELEKREAMIASGTSTLLPFGGGVAVDRPNPNFAASIAKTADPRHGPRARAPA